MSKRAEVPPAAELPTGAAGAAGLLEGLAGSNFSVPGLEDMVSTGMDLGDGVSDINQILKQMENADHALQFFESKAEEVLAKLNAILAEAGISPDDEDLAANESKTFEEEPSIIQIEEEVVQGNST
ncbi:hypothetical protein HDU67_003476 [Dinochytrium kinnereticum]|nr:hypothetical protein HDU67_003476 [Dinochytrium kinnereticum]